MTSVDKPFVPRVGKRLFSGPKGLQAGRQTPN
jgi:hypothetical protein